MALSSDVEKYSLFKSTLKFVKFLQLLKVNDVDIYLTFSGIVIDVKLVQFLNAASPILVMLSESVTDVKFIHLQNADSPILVIPLLMIIFFL